MKRHVAISLVMCLAAISAGAQTMYDAIGYSDYNYVGTARSAALGNALTAVGGDLGSVGINPAGGAVAGYSQITISPGLGIYTTASSYAPEAYGDFGSPTRARSTRLMLPNCGVMLNFSTGRKYGVKNVAVGLVSNTSNIYSDTFDAGGRNSQTSMMGEAAHFTNGIDPSALDASNAYYQGYNWQDVLAYRAGFTSYMDDIGEYIGSTEVLLPDGRIVMGGPINQSYYRKRIGTKNDVVITTSFNVNDRFYFGFNIGLPTIRYSESLNKMETAVDPNDFAMELDGVNTSWTQGRQRYSIETTGSGIYAKAGFIWLPVKGLRIGAAIQTPTLLTMRERWMWDATCVFTHNSFSAETPEGDYSYNISTPFSFNVGAAYTFGRGLVSVDYERRDFSAMRFSEVERQLYSNDPFSEDNSYIRSNAGVANNLRVGAEILLTDALSLRAGYSLKSYKESNLKDNTNTFSGGLGYSSPRSFFCDFAVRYTKYPASWFYPYEDYLDDVRSPEVSILKSGFGAVVTFGWRF